MALQLRFLPASPSSTLQPWKSHRPPPPPPLSRAPRVTCSSPPAPISSHAAAITSAVSQTLASFQYLAASVAAGLQPKPSDSLAIEAIRRSLSLSAVTAVAPSLCLAAISTNSVNTPLTVVASGMAKWLELYSGVLMVRVLLSWFPNIPWERQPLQAIRDMCDPYLNLFRNIIPPLFNALDVSPLLAFLVLGVLTSILNTTIHV